MENISTTVPTWQHPILPGQALQGNILVTKNDFKEPPQSQSNFEWVDIEDLCGVHDVKMTYDKDNAIGYLWKTGGHRNQDGTWVEDWICYGSIKDLPEEVVDSLQKMTYLEYKFTISDNSIKFEGVRKDQTVDDLGTFTVYSIEQVDNKLNEITTNQSIVNNSLQEQITNEVNNRTNADINIQTDYNDKITTETNERKSADDNIKADIDSKVQYAIQYALNVVSQLNNEIEVRKANDNNLQTQITDEVTNRTNADSYINQTMKNNYNDLDARIKAISGSAIKTEVVETKPTTPTNNTIYYIGKDGKYEQWLYTNDTWYDMGSTQIDLTPYEKIVDHNNDINNLQTQITTNKSNIEENKNSIDNINTTLKGVNTTLNNHQTSINTNTNNIATNKTNIATNTTNIATNTSDIANLKTQVAQQKIIAGDQINVSTSSTGSTIALKGTSETWTFTLQDGTTVDRTIRYF